MAQYYKRPVGRPKKYTDPKLLAADIDAYFEFCDNRTKEIYQKDAGLITIPHPAPYTMSGLALALGMYRETLLNYSKDEDYFDTIKAAREKVHNDVENRLMETRNQSGAIFNLKNNFGWRDEKAVDHTSKGDKLPTPILGGASVDED